MTTIPIVVDGEEKTLYVDGRLYEQIQTRVLPSIMQKDNDALYIIDGKERAGKSTFAQQLAKTLDPSFNLDRMCFTPEEFTKCIMSASKGQAVVFDEAFTGLSSRASLSEINRLLVSLMMEMGQKNLFVLIVMPTFFLLDKYVVLWRARGLFHVYKKKGKRGFWMYFNEEKKKRLYLEGKKLYSYKWPRSSFMGRFYNQYTVNEQAYRDKKAHSLNSKPHEVKGNKYMQQRNILFYIMYHDFQKSQEQISRICKKRGMPIASNRLTDVIKDAESTLSSLGVDPDDVSEEEALKTGNRDRGGGLKMPVVKGTWALD